MTLYYTMVFMLLMLEMSLFVVLIVPLPFTLKRRIFTYVLPYVQARRLAPFLSENPLVAKVQYGMKITFIFILILFIDSVNRVYRVQVELGLSSENAANGAAIIGRERLEVQARKFYSQRNMYLCGFTLFLSLILNRTYTMILEVLRLEEKLKKYEGTAADTKQSEKLAQAGEFGEIGNLKKELAKKDRDIETLKKQAQGLQREYDDLCEKYGATQAPAGPKKTK
ncbi:B-cell receptor-associated protein 31-like containing protein [Sporothrix schenckii 1099-18]|uniref:Endoplasmic reticulum transmembrane protein n=1 Tax=Sporothrix schenckii 1099-18 TaxID=1397361 RepID=A0A0F2MAR8_SPOSC|nr:B-cell receptor-associated protein 31-like containing protein [Sporothrix schenckii 1099-18]KJR85920.1 B-cell receptor-associated protein 31-like containing protein [Sporothrix schenckii 1099-18]